ncbi:hypothetical protein Tco_1489159, partial [Tanacetum coccineum]
DKEMLANKGVFRNAYSSQESEQGVEKYCNELQSDPFWGLSTSSKAPKKTAKRELFAQRQE